MFSFPYYDAYFDSFGLKIVRQCNVVFFADLIFNWATVGSNIKMTTLKFKVANYRTSCTSQVYYKITFWVRGPVRAGPIIIHANLLKLA